MENRNSNLVNFIILYHLYKDFFSPSCTYIFYCTKYFFPILIKCTIFRHTFWYCKHSASIVGNEPKKVQITVSFFGGQILSSRIHIL